MINYAKDKIPKYAIPTRLLKLDSIPLNANGKIDRQRLLGLITKNS